MISSVNLAALKIDGDVHSDPIYVNMDLTR